MEVCYAYRGIGRVIVEMGPSDWAAWVGAIATVVAAISVFSIYNRGRKDAQRDQRSRRRVLYAMLSEHVRTAVAFVSQSLARLKLIKPDVSHADLRLYMLGFELTIVDRLIALQQDLVSFGDDGDEMIAAFIEDCRQDSKTHRGWNQMIQDVHQPVHFDQDGPLALGAIRTILHRMSANAASALNAIERFAAR